MGAYRNTMTSMAYRQALAHPVFAHERKRSAAREEVSAAPLPRAHLTDETGVEKQRIARDILDFLDIATKHWPEFAPHAPELRILMDLFVHELAGRPVAVTDACMASHVPCTSALRSIDRLLDEGLLERHTDPTDSRRKLLALTARSYALIALFMDDCCEERRARR